MILQTTGSVTPLLHVLGPSDLPAFLIQSDPPVLIDAGMSAVAPQYIREAKALLNGRGPADLFLTHVHYDHCGAAALLKKAFPEMRICCSEAGKDLLMRPNAVATIGELNHAGAGYLQQMGQADKEAPEFEVFEVDRVIEDDQSIALAPDLSLQAFATPGHTRDSMSFYVPEQKILFTGEAAGIMAPDGYIFSEWLTDYTDYMNSLEKLADLEVEILCPGHGFVLTGKDAADYMPRAIESGHRFRELIETTLAQTDWDVEQTKQHIKQIEYDPLADPKQPEFAYLLNLDAKIRAVMRVCTQ
ncbi:glyoxylase-like metal-dependent hydrolase (beta-lactamase superfamily II) [Desulfosalsimonas propionicica]|uniref:Glyoxylase-like metal-dependent hydrolase (Beta-lactamase superfamily II) n=1 Tax=Desulfosalsimonas propionicica TaxID=332175 RepID=A0A7W0HJ73_9BACT|nr:MBL fold metallo-hydrolase [Desulfosalsimonas propionicica]MBA2879813.1 glyoxylase-like metal-dependent hydrolase (beta-lactamase superfamily II) [Desulfosalsimonas propionicica]